MSEVIKTEVFECLNQKVRMEKGKEKVWDYSLSDEGRRTIAHIVENEEGTPELVAFSENLGRFLAKPKAGTRSQSPFKRRWEDHALTTSQIRNIFGEVKKIEMYWERDDTASWTQLQLLRPKLAYAAKKADVLGSFALREVLSEAILHVKGSEERGGENFRRFSSFFEAILAYHRAAGGRTN